VLSHPPEPPLTAELAEWALAPVGRDIARGDDRVLCGRTRGGRRGRVALRRVIRAHRVRNGRGGMVVHTRRAGGARRGDSLHGPHTRVNRPRRFGQVENVSDGAGGKV
jgi:hypothetical protein